MTRIRAGSKGLLLGVLMLLLSGAALPQPADNGPTLSACHELHDTGDTTANACYRAILNRIEDPALRAEALWRLGDIAGANRAFRRATEVDPDDPDVRARWGHLFLDAHQAADADALFTDALTIDPNHVDALLGQAKLFAKRFEGRAEVVITQILVLSPDNAKTRLLRARLLLEDQSVPAAREILLDIVGSEPATRPLLNAYALLAAADHMEGNATALPRKQPKSDSQWVAKALELNPRFGDIYAVPAYFYVITRRYKEAVALLERAVAVDGEHWGAHTELGTNLLRVNRMEDARRHLQLAYSGDPFNAETVNTLRLLDSLDEFDTVVSDNLILRAHPQESAVLTRYVRELVSKVEAEMAGRYGFILQSPAVLELYQRHDDFAVRTAGLPGIGILGAAFGDVVVMDGPSAKAAAEFDWYSALWHELAHVVTLNATNNLVSRWFSEGVSVYEERRFGPSPNESVPLEFLDAMHNERLLPTAELDNGFMRPEYENQIGVSYEQAGLLCAYIADQYPNGLKRMLDAYRDGAGTVAAIELALGVTSTELDKGFFAHLSARFGAAAAQLEALSSHGRAAARAVDEERWADAERAARLAIEIYPGYIGRGSPYLVLAEASEASAPGGSNKTMNALHEYFRRGGRQPGALQRLATLLHDDDKTVDAIDVQHVLARLDPLDLEHHKKLGQWLAAQNLHEEALPEFQAVLALDPHDKAAAHYQVASTLHHLKRTEEARRELLYALEIAPRFSAALALLIEINQ